MANCPMMDMPGMGLMMGGTALIGILLLVALLLSIAALWKYLRSGHSKPSTP